MQEPEYVRTPEGIRFSDSQGSLGPPLQTGLALMYDRVEGVVLRHGEASAVDALYQQYIAALAGTALTSDIVMLGFDLAHLTSLLLSGGEPRDPDRRLPRHECPTPRRTGTWEGRTTGVGIRPRPRP